MKLTNVVIPPQFRLILWGLVVGLLIFLGWLWLQSRDERQQTQASAEQGVRTGVAVTGITQDASDAADETQRVEITVTDARSAYQRGYQDAKREDPSIADWAAQPVPQRLRDLARERRLARERLGCSGDGCGDDDRTSGN